ncbi:putative RNA-directed DNA polymerase, eukaryota, reverse transcriptase zinc-binding domain protein [Tanacetum coccineum]
MRFTRMNPACNKISKLDRFLVSSHFLDQWPSTYTLPLVREYSKHSPVLLHVSTDDFRPTLFHFYNSWLVHGWRKDSLITENATVSKLWDTLHDIDSKAKTSTLSHHEVEQRLMTVKELADFEHLKCKDLPQKAKSRWALKGEEKSRGCNSSFITLVPKIDDPLSLNDFRPISLIGCQYKIISKILANRLAMVISAVVSEVQTAFIKEHQIVDGPFIMDEIISWARLYKKKIFILKVDFERAFDTLNWSFLDSIMAQMGFSSKLRNWISACLHSAFTSILVNGSPTPEFKLEKGLRQGDPLSPFLFILVVEDLNVVLEEAKNRHIFKGVEVGRDKVNVLHLQFADDAIVLGDWSYSNIKNLSSILTCFHIASGLMVNFNKSQLFGIGVNNKYLNSLAPSIGCQPSHFPCTYLGLPIGAKMSRSANWTPIIDRFLKRLSN